MTLTQTAFFQPWISLWTARSAAPRRLARRWALVRLRCRTIDQLTLLSDHQLRDLGLEESPYHEGALRDACHLKARLSGRWVPHVLPAAEPQHWP